MNFSIALLPEDIALFHSLYRTSIKGRKALVNAAFSDEDEGILSMDSSYTSRVSEIFRVTLKSMGIELDFEDEDNEIKILNRTNMSPHELNGSTYICSDYQFFILERMSRIREEILLNNPVMTMTELDEAVDHVLKTTKFLNGEYEEDLDGLELNVKTENEKVFAKIQEEKMKKETADIAESLTSVSEVNIDEV